MIITTSPGIEQQLILLRHIHTTLSVKGAVNMVLRDKIETRDRLPSIPLSITIPVNYDIAGEEGMEFRIVPKDYHLYLYGSSEADDCERELARLPYSLFMTCKEVDAGCGFESVWVQFPTERFRYIDEWDVFETSLEKGFDEYLAHIESLF